MPFTYYALTKKDEGQEYTVYSNALFYSITAASLLPGLPTFFIVGMYLTRNGVFSAFLAILLCATIIVACVRDQRSFEKLKLLPNADIEYRSIGGGESFSWTEIWVKKDR